MSVSLQNKNIDQKSSWGFETKPETWKGIRDLFAYGSLGVVYETT
jgi:hypothetical protein